MNERVSSILKHPATVPVGVGVISFGIGIGFGMLLEQRRNYQKNKLQDVIVEINADTSKYDEAFKEDNSTIEVEYEEKNEHKPVIIDEKDLRVAQGRIVAERLKRTMTMDKEPAPEFTSTIFAGDDEDWNFEVEVKSRTRYAPYILHKDEFFSNEEEYTQSTLSYFAGDDIMCDEDDSPVYGYHNIVGDLKFGHGSGDPNVFYVRNDKQKAEFEITYNTGHYAVEVQGLEIENNERVKDLKHSNVRRFRDE